MQKIKVFIPTLNRADTISSHKLFQDPNLWDTTILMNNNEGDRLGKYKSFNPEINESNVEFTNQPVGQSGFTLNRLYVAQNTPLGEWSLYIGDNVLNVSNSNGGVLSEEEVHKKLLESIKYAEFMGQSVIGFLPTSNTFFADGKIKSGTYFCWGKATLIKNTSWMQTALLEVAEHCSVKEDYAISLFGALKDGGCVRNGDLFFNGSMYKKGGIGSKNSREEANKKGITYLVDKFTTQIVTENPKRDGEVLINSLSPNQVKEWRIKMIMKGKLEEDYIYKIIKDKKIADTMLKAIQARKALTNNDEKKNRNR